jgi:EAL domain-containing protein (putative c-di-GMP-specific phosphodiesterase class I)
MRSVWRRVDDLTRFDHFRTDAIYFEGLLTLDHDRKLVSVRDCVRETGFPLERLELEIVETAFFQAPASAEAQLRHLRSFGIGLALDDFGTGYSSLSYLRRMPFTKVKIDKSFIDDVMTVESAAIVHAVIALARAIGLKVTAEGVETTEQQQFLRLAGCHYLQGYLFSKPVPPAEIDARLGASSSGPIDDRRRVGASDGK